MKSSFAWVSPPRRSASSFAAVCRPLLALALGLLVSDLGCAQVILDPNTIGGRVEFSNVNPEILALLGEPGQEGMTWVYVSAASLPPAPPMSTSSEETRADTRTGTDYRITVDTDANGIAYTVAPRVRLLADVQTYYFAGQSSAPVVSGGPGVTLDFAECLGVLTVRFRDTTGEPLGVDGGTMTAHVQATGDWIAQRTVPAGATEARLYVRGGVPLRIDVTVNRGTDFYLDRVTFESSVEATVNCDEFATVDVAIPGAEALGRIRGRVDLVGEFELTVDGSDALDYPDSTGVLARNGPFGNQRWDALPGTHFTVPSSGDYLLPSVVPSTFDPASPGYTLQAQMYIRSGRATQFFQSPRLGSGANPPLVVAPDADLDLGELLVIRPGHLEGRVFLQGPAEALGRGSLLRGMLHAGDSDSDQDGVPDGIGTYGVYWSSVSATGTDTQAAGATYTASGGQANTDFAGDFDPATSAYIGQYDLVLGGLDSEPTYWQPGGLTLVLGSPAGAPAQDYFYTSLWVQDRLAPPTLITPGETATAELAFCFSEVRVVFRSESEPFHSPEVRFSTGSFTGTDFQGNPADYQVYLDAAFGMPNTPETAATTGEVVMYLPQGTYRLLPFVTPPDSRYGRTGLEPIDLTVGCGQRIALEPCLQVRLTAPDCAQPGPLRVSGEVKSCDQAVTQIHYTLNGGDPVTVCTDCGPNPVFALDLALAEGPNTLVVTAQDAQGGSSAITSVIGPDREAPSIQCPAHLTVPATRPCGARVEFSVAATDNCPGTPAVVCTPPSGSLFPKGDNVVTCTATDAAGNTAECRFTVTVSGGADWPAPVLSAVTPIQLAATGGSRVTVLGSNFTEDDEILLGGQPVAEAVLLSPGEIQGLSPALAPGRHVLEVRRCGQVVLEFAGTFEAGELPRIARCEPREGFARGGGRLRIAGMNLGPETRVRIGFPAPDGTANLLRNVVVSEDGTELTGEVPPLPEGELPGSRDVILEDPRGGDLLVAGFLYLPNPVETDPQVLSLRELERVSQRPLDLTWRNGFPSGLLTRVRAEGATPIDRARGFVGAFRDLLRLEAPASELSVGRFRQDGLDDVSLVQNYRGVPVFGGEVMVTLSDDEVVALTGNLLPLAALDARQFEVTPRVTPEEAIQIARQADPVVPPPGAPLDPKAVLMVFDECLFREAPLDPHLVWHVTMNATAYETLVDAHTGVIVLQLPVGRSGDLDLDIQDAEREANAQNDCCFNWSDDTDVADEDDFNSDYNNDLDAVLANRFARDAFEFYHRLNWHSYDNDDAQLEVFIHTTINPNVVAQWTKGCDLIQFADGAVDYEVMVHEFTHGVVASTSGLVYLNQSGALDESYADTMGVIADRERGEVETGAALNWTIMENRRAPQPTAALRSFDNPPSINGDPDRMANYQNLPANNDFGGVHSNSGIPNKAGFLMIAGGSFQGFLVAGIGLEKVKQIKFRALRALPANASFADARAREIAAAEDLARRGELGFVAADACTVRNAWAAVGVGRGDSNCDGKEDDFNDVDKDLIPDVIDNCRRVANPGQQNADGDRYGDACDNCPNVPNDGQEDADDDKTGDVCDRDRDGDGCDNDVDQHPDSRVARIGSAVNVLCPDRSSPVYGSEAVDTDGDGQRNCRDTDDDQDDIPDDQDPCPIGNLPNSIDGGCTVLGEACPLIPNNWWMICRTGGCNEFFARFQQRINPDPTRTVIVDRVDVLNQTLYLRANLGSTIADTARAIAQRGRGGGLAGAGPELWRLELWSRPTDTEPARLVALVGDYDLDRLEAGPFDLGALLAFNPPAGDLPPRLAATWHVGDDPATVARDTDRDGMADGWEDRYGLDAFNPADAAFDLDGDGLSNADEFRAGTNPADAESRFRILGIQRRGTGVQVDFAASATRSYQLEKTTDLGRLPWNPVGPVVVGRDGPLAIVDPDPGPDPQVFYRVRAAAE